MSVDKRVWQKCIDFHGHTCPGLAIGYRAALAVQKKLETGFSADEEIVCITENDACGVDAIQVITGCSIGKGNLIYCDTGKHAFSFYSRNSGRKTRIIFTMPLEKDENWDKAAMEKKILTAPDDELFSFTEPLALPPERARVFRSVRCEKCGESAPENKIRLHIGKKLCLTCFPDYSRGW